MNNTKKLRTYKTQNGVIPFTKWLNSLNDHMARIQIHRRMDRLILGHYGDYKIINYGLKELRLHIGPGYRIYIKDVTNEIIILLCGGNKSTQHNDIEKATNYWLDLLETDDEN